MESHQLAKSENELATASIDDLLNMAIPVAEQPPSKKNRTDDHPSFASIEESVASTNDGLLAANELFAFSSTLDEASFSRDESTCDKCSTANTPLHHETITIIDPIQVAAKIFHDYKPAAVELPHAALPSTGTSAFVNFSDRKPAAEPAELDSLSCLPEDVLFRITGFLDAPDLLLCLGAASKRLQSLCRKNGAGWNFLCSRLWDSKVHVSHAALECANKCTAYKISLQDALNRDNVTLEEFCYNEDTDEGTVWSFRFKESAGTDWTNADPWYHGQLCRKMVFLSDGRMMQLITSEKGTRSLTDPHMRMHWRFLTRPMDLQTRVTGSYVRISVAGRDVPTYSVRRSPTGNWGFVLESCWGVYASFELPPKLDVVLRRGSDGTIVTVHPEAQRPPTSADMQDDSMLLTNEVQWREAFLYNVGARVLPEGDEATNDFDRAWHDAGR